MAEILLVSNIYPAAVVALLLLLAALRWSEAEAIATKLLHLPQ
jgi:dihydrodipicolinate synthase/N-acetylneuraminate lyase